MHQPILDVPVLAIQIVRLDFVSSFPKAYTQRLDVFSAAQDDNAVTGRVMEEFVAFLTKNKILYDERYICD